MDSRVYDYQQYHQDICQLLEQLSRPEEFNQACCLMSLRVCDEKWVKSLNEDSTLKSVFFTRHGQCSSSHKGFGFTPNTALEDTALPFIKKAGSNTQYLFSTYIKLHIAISPMLRPLQTASLLIPYQFTDSIEIVSFLTENSGYPSGKPIYSAEDLAKESGFMAYASSFFYNNENYFNGLNKACKDAKQKITDKLKQTEGKDITLKEASIDNLTEAEKINSIDKHIEKIGNKEDVDIWFIGHGKNTEKYYEKFGVVGQLDYCETRKIIHFQDRDGNAKIFVTPYALSIDQNTGLFKGMIMPSNKLVILNNTQSRQTLKM